MNYSKKFYIKLFLTYYSTISMLIPFIACPICGIMIKDDDIAGKFILGFIIFGFIGFLLFKGYKGNYIHFSTSHGNIYFSIHNDYKDVGIPNNKYDEFKVTFNEFCNDDLYFKETSKGVYESKIGEKNIIINLKGWFNKKYYLYEYFFTIVQLELTKKEKRNVNLITEKLFSEKINNLNLIIKDFKNKIHKIKLIENNYSQPKIKFRRRFVIKYKSDPYSIGIKATLEKLFNFNL
jgi:hypothetical protein